jgi:hypothetical protein
MRRTPCSPAQGRDFCPGFEEGSSALGPPKPAPPQPLFDKNTGEQYSLHDADLQMKNNTGLLERYKSDLYNIKYRLIATSPCTLLRNEDSAGEASVVESTLVDPQTDHLLHAVGKIGPTLGHPVSERRGCGNLSCEDAVGRVTWGDSRTVGATLPDLRYGLDK